MLSFDILERANSTAYKYGDLIVPAAAPFAVTRANMRLSLVNGSAFIDMSAAGALTPYLDHLVTITDAAGKSITGYIKTAGSGETYGSELVVNGDMSSATGWTVQAGWAISGGVATATSAAAGRQVYRGFAGTIGALYRSTMDVLTLTGGTFDMMAGNLRVNQAATTGAHTLYGLATGSTIYAAIMSITSLSGSFDNYSTKRVLTPSATGVTIVSTRGGTTQNWASVETGFNYNDTSGYTITIERRHVFMCTTAGTSASAQPAFDIAPEHTTSDGTVTWTECNPVGVVYTGAFIPANQPKYGDLVRCRKYAQPVSFTDGGDVYIYDKSIGIPRETREITWNRMIKTDLETLLDFIDLTRGGRFTFRYTDEDAVIHTARLLNADDITSTPTDAAYEGNIMMELYLLI